MALKKNPAETEAEKAAEEARQKIEAHLKALVSKLPKDPGVYQFKDEKGTVIYVGKAKNLRNRVRTYFQKKPKDAYPKTEIMRRKITDIELITVRSEVEALILETNLIKQLRPKYNVVMRDDKNFLYVKITTNVDFPEIYTVRRMMKDGATYFGPYTSAESVRITLKILRKIFPYRACQGVIEQLDVPPAGTSALPVTAKATPVGKEELREGKVVVRIKGLNRMAPCLDYHIKQCSAPCIGRISREEYRVLIENIIQFLRGRTDEIVQLIQSRMEESVVRKAFEEAAQWRDQLTALSNVLEKQHIVSTRAADHDVIGIGRDRDIAVANIFKVRNGHLIGRETFPLRVTEPVEGKETIVSGFIAQYYSEAADIPEEILIPEKTESHAALEKYLSGLRGSRVTVTVPKRGDKRRLIELAQTNAERTIEDLKVRWMTDEARTKGALKELAQALHLPVLRRIECYDISHTQGTQTTASMIVFQDGEPLKSQYRRFKVKSLPEGRPDDFASMMEVLERRLRYIKDQVQETTAENAKKDDLQDVEPNVEKRSTENEKRPSGFSEIPDLIILDGGKGQLSSVLTVMRSLGLEQRLAIVALAKREEELFLPQTSEPLVLPRGSNALYLVQRIRDEAHRFALSYHQYLRSKKMVKSVLDEIPGIGRVAKKKLLDHFGSVAGIRSASLEEVQSVVGEKTATRVKQSL